MPFIPKDSLLDALVWACDAKEDNDWVKKCMEYEVDGL